VNSSLDNETNDAFCTLREAIKAANTNTSYNGCVSGSGTDTIVFSVNSANVDTSMPQITADLIVSGIHIDNSRTALIVNQAMDMDVFNVATTVNVTINNVEIKTAVTATSQNDGRAIVMAGSGNLLLDGVTIANMGELSTVRHGAAVYSNGAKVVIRNSSFDNNYVQGNGAAVYVENADLSVEDSSFSGNTANAGHGGAICKMGTGVVTIKRSRFVSNVAGGDGGAFASNSTAEIVNSVFAENTALSEGSAIYSAATTASIHNTTVVDNLLGNQNNLATANGAIFNAGTTLNIQHTIVSGNEKVTVLSPFTKTSSNCGGVWSSFIYSIINGNTGCSFSGGFSTTSTNGYPHLTDWNVNGNRIFVVPHKHSTSVDAGDMVNGCKDASGNLITDDLLGRPRPQKITAASAVCDIGAIELMPVDVGISMNVINANSRWSPTVGVLSNADIDIVITNNSSIALKGSRLKITIPMGFALFGSIRSESFTTNIPALAGGQSYTYRASFAAVVGGNPDSPVNASIINDIGYASSDTSANATITSSFEVPPSNSGDSGGGSFDFFILALGLVLLGRHRKKVRVNDFR
ncbi:MAG: CSLREA domain-containing protein, partial [Gammaproteobacteria bacterium]|nr:CSLREA domain-containing protein [Gammaproteobacteria bacterium]